MVRILPKWEPIHELSYIRNHSRDKNPRITVMVDFTLTASWNPQKFGYILCWICLGVNFLKGVTFESWDRIMKMVLTSVTDLNRTKDWIMKNSLSLFQVEHQSPALGLKTQTRAYPLLGPASSPVFRLWLELGHWISWTSKLPTESGKPIFFIIYLPIKRHDLHFMV